MNDSKNQITNLGQIKERYIVVTKNQQSVSSNLSLQPLKKSNAGYRWDWNEKSLVGKFFVAVFGEEEYLDEEENEVKISVKVQEVRSAEAWKNGDIKIPALKKLKNRPETKTTKKEDNDSFYESSKQLASEEDLPF